MNIDCFKILEAASITIASFVAIYGISSWRREAKWKRKYELAEDVLSCCYEISETFDFMRSPFSSVDEGKTRKKNNNESEEDSEILDNAYVLIERYENNKAPFVKLETLKYRFMAVYGKEAIKPLDEIFILRNKLFQASKMLGNRYWKNRGHKEMTEQQEKVHYEKMAHFEKIFWTDFNETDEFKQSVNLCISKIEHICQNIIEKG